MSGDFGRRAAPPSSSMGPPAAEAEEEEREPGALAPRQLPGDDLSVAAGASGAFATSSVDFGFGNSWSHIPIPVGHHFVGAHHHHSPRDIAEGLHDSQSGGGASPGRDGSAGAAGRHSDDDKVMSDSHPAALSSPARRISSGEEAHPAAAAGVVRARGGLEPTLAYARDASSTGSLAEVELGERRHAHGSSVSGSRIGGVDTPPGSSPVGEGRHPATPTEQVSLPDDIYGAARVSEYWHGVPGLSSLASTYVYDDIWAGDGGLNPREDIISITGWAAGGGHAATKERGGGGEAVAEILGAGSQARGGQQSQTAHPSPAGHASASSGDDKGPGSRRRRAAKRATSGGGHEDESARDSSEERSGVRSWGTGGGTAHSSAATGRGHGEGRGGEGHASKKRRTPSPEAERRMPAAARMVSADSAAGADEAARDASSREQQAMQEAEMIRWCQKVSSARAMSTAAAAAGGSGGDGGIYGSGSSGDEERFFAGRLLDPAPRPPPRGRGGGSGDLYTRNVSINNSSAGWGEGMMGELSPAAPPEVALQRNGEGGDGYGAGGGRGGGSNGDLRTGDDRAARTAHEARAALASGATATPSAAFSEAAQAVENRAAVPTTGAAGSGHGPSCSSPSSSDTKHEAFFACHTLEPKPRPGGTVVPLAAQGGPREQQKYPHSIGGGGGRAGSGTVGLSSAPGSSDEPGSHRLIPREEDVLATVAAPAKAAAAVSAIDSSSSTDWQVRPEAMMGFFTTVGGVSPPSVLCPGRRRAFGVRARSTSSVVTPGTRGKQFAVPGAEPYPHGLASSRTGSGSGRDGGASPGAGGDVDAAVAAAAARERAAGTANDAKLPSNNPGSASSSSNGWNGGSAGGGGDGGGVEGGGNSGWGW